MMLEEVRDAIRNYPGVTRKNAIHSVVDSLPAHEFEQVYAFEGEDAAAIDYGENYVLFATDGIMESLLNTDPFRAGYYAVLVNISDISAMGGRPMAMVDVMSLSKGRVCKQILSGMNEAVQKFGVPIVGGHTHPDCKYNAIDVAIIGTVPKDDIILSTEAQDGDDVVFVMDMHGYYPEGLRYAWDTTSDKTAQYVRAQLDASVRVASEHLVHSGKDISNPGCIGTLGMMLESSSMGGIVDINRIPYPENVDPIQWILSFQGCGFVFACPPENSARVIEIFEEVGCTGAVVGKVKDDHRLDITDGKDTLNLFDFTKDVITGCRPKE